MKAYTYSSKSVNKSPGAKKLSTYSNDVKILSYHTKNNFTQKINFSNYIKVLSQNKTNKNNIKIVLLNKSYIRFL